MEEWLDDLETQVISEEEVYKGFLTVKKYTLQHERFDGGMTNQIQREVITPPGEGVAVLLVDKKLGEFVLVEQFRMGPYAVNKVGHRSLEVVAGYHEQGESKENSAKREIEEETGLFVQKVSPIFSYWTSPGANGERLNLFWAEVDSTKAKSFAGCEEENEDIRVRRIAFSEIYELLDAGIIDNAMTIMCLQWYKLNHMKPGA